MGLLFFRGETCVTKQIKDAQAPFSMCVHCVAHWINLVVKSLFNLTLFAQLEVFMGNLHSYFSHSPKWHLDFQKFITAMETKGNKILKNV